MIFNTLANKQFLLKHNKIKLARGRCIKTFKIEFHDDSMKNTKYVTFNKIDNFLLQFYGSMQNVLFNYH